MEVSALEKLKNLNVLYVEDNKIACDSLRPILEGLFKSVDAESDNEKSCVLFDGDKRLKYDIVVARMDAYRAHLNALNRTIAQQKEVLEEQLYSDPLTELPNKNSLDSVLEKILPTDVPSLFLINIDQFKNYNKLYGMDVGNQILHQFAHHLKEVAATLKYKAFRISSNEFVMLQINDELDPEAIYEDITYTLNILNGIELKVPMFRDKILVNISMGVTFDQENLLNKAFMALDFAKRTDRPFVVYTSNLDESESLANDFYWQDIIADTLDNDNVVPFFQPISNKCGVIGKFEALIRIRTKDKQGEEKYISPYHFLDVARRTKQYDSLSYKMIEKVLDIAYKNPTIVFTINLSFRDMQNKDIRDLVRGAVGNMQTDNNIVNIVFEVIESEKVTDNDVIVNFLKYIKYTDGNIAIDDFGTGYSNFVNIIEMNPTYLKIDGSLVKNIDTDRKSFLLVKAIVSFAKTLNIKTVAEFIHNEIIFNHLVEMGIDEFQGYFIGEPTMEHELICKA